MEKEIYLRALEPEDLDFLYEMENDESLWEVGNTNVPYSRQVLLDYITTSSADIYADKQVRFIIENEMHERVGIIDLMNFDPRHLRAEVGIVVKKDYGGKVSLDWLWLVFCFMLRIYSICIKFMRL